MQKIFEFLSYPSTWKGIVTVATMVLAYFKIDIDPELAGKIAAGGLTVVGVISTFFSDSDTASQKGE